MLENKKPEERADARVKHASDIIGNWGPFQRRLFIFYIITYAIAPFQNIGIVFMGPTIGFWCKRPAGYENATAVTCSSYENPDVKCTEWKYDLSFYKSTIVDEWDLVCDRAWLVSFAQSMYQIGYGISAIGISLFSDRFGRFTAYKWSILFEIVAGISQALSVNVYHFIISRLFLGITAYGRFLSGYLLVLEIVGPKIRARMSVYSEFGWGFGYMLLPAVFYLIPHFRYVQLMVAAFEVLFLYWLFQMPESSRWLLTNGRFEEARVAITKAAQEKGKLSETQIEAKIVSLKEYLDEEEEKRKYERKQTLFDMFKVPRLLIYSLLLYFIWLSNSFVYYGLSLNAGDLGGDIFVNFVVYGVAGILSKVFTSLIVNHFDRKKLMSFNFTFAGLCFFLMIPFFVTDSGLTFRLILGFLGKFFNENTGLIVYLYTAEVFPTTLRQIGVGSSSVAARVGSVLAPFVKELSVYTHPWVPMAIFGTLSLASSVVFCFLPETKGKDIQDTIRETGEELETKLDSHSK